MGWLLTRLPIGEIAFRVNLMNAFFDAVAVVLVYLIGLQLGAPVRGWTTYEGTVLGALALFSGHRAV
ncbi:MAG: hypothetical protein DDG58_15015 [Ardenticatenia bacterium]|nr:MAG: hypothetical protein DDG58_15015 [Ardenticatenia bacterium]